MEMYPIVRRFYVKCIGLQLQPNHEHYLGFRFIKAATTFSFDLVFLDVLYIRILSLDAFDCFYFNDWGEFEKFLEY